MSQLTDFGNETVLQFIRNSIKKNIDVKKILDIKYVTGKIDEEEEDRSSQGFFYERLWDICIKFGATKLTLPTINGKIQTSHVIDENPNKTNISFNPYCWTGALQGYLYNKVRSGSSGGYSDITFFNKKDDNEELFFISCKYFEKEKEISKYDIGKLCALISKHKNDKREIKVFIFVKNKKEAIKKFNAQNSSSNILIKYINPGGNYENVYDIKDLQLAFKELKDILKPYNYLETSKDIENFEKEHLKVLRKPFRPRFHQKLFILKINKLIEENEKNILVGAIPRSGKSYIMAGTIIDYVKNQVRINPGKKVKILMMTPAPNETLPEYKKIFDEHSDFKKLGIDINEYTDKGNKKISSEKHSVIIISKQRLGWKQTKAEKALNEEYDEEQEEGEEDSNKDTKKETIYDIKQNIKRLFTENPDIDLMFLDEAHFGMSTEEAQKIVDALENTISGTVKIYVTATYNKPLQAYGVKSKCKITWDMENINTIKNIDEKTIINNPIHKQFGEHYEEALDYFGDKTGLSLIDMLKKEYSIFPKPYMITSIWDKDFLNIEKSKIVDTEFGWNMNKLFSTTGGIFTNEEQVKEMMRYYLVIQIKRMTMINNPFIEKGVFCQELERFV